MNKSKKNLNCAIIVGTSCPTLGWGINDLIQTPHLLINPNIKTFPNGEKFCEFKETVRGKTCFVIQNIAPSINSNINDNLLELLIMVDALKRSSAKQVIAVIPFLGYSRQDRRVQSRSPISSRLIADMIQTSGVDHVITMDLHSMQGEGFYKIPFDNLKVNPIIIDKISKYDDNDLCIVSPDIGGVSRSREISAKLNLPLAIIDKRRDLDTNRNEVMNLIGDVSNKKCIVFDDMIDTGGTLIKATQFLKSQGAKEIDVYATHGVFSNKSYITLENEPSISQIFVSNTIEQNISDKIILLKVDSIFAHCIDNIMNNESINE